MYQVTSNKAVTVTSELGSTATLKAGETKYLYLIKGANTLQKSDTSATLTVTALENNGMDYFNQVTIGTQPVISGQEDSISKDLYKSLAPGASYTFTYTPSKGMAGLVYPYLYFTDNVENKIRVTSDTGFYADILKPAGYQSTLCWADAAKKDIELLYVRGGKNTITIENIGNNTAVLNNINIHSAGELSNNADWGSQINVASLKPVAYVLPDPTPTPTATTKPTVAPTGAPSATPAATPTATPAPVLPDVSNADLYTVIEAEDSISTALTEKTAYNGKAVLKLTDMYTEAEYKVAVEQKTIYNLNLVGAAWKDVNFDLYVDGVLYDYLTMHFHNGRTDSWSYLQEEVASLPLDAGNHTLKFVFYCDTFYFDSIVLEDTNSMYYHLIHDFCNVTTSQGAYDLLEHYGEAANIDVAADTADQVFGPMSFWKMVAKDYKNEEELLKAYNECLSDPIVTVTNSSGQEVASLPAGNANVSVDCADIPADISLVAAVYSGNKLVGVTDVTREGDVATATFTNLAAGCKLKVFAFSDADTITPYAKDVYGTPYREIYVATTGKASNAGTKEAPVNNLANALKLVKKYNSDMTGDIIVYIAPGTYKSSVTIEIDSTMGGKNGHKVIIRAEDMNNKPILSGGEDLSGKWKKVSGENYYVASTSTRETRALFVNGYQATMARSEGWYRGVPIDPASPKNDSHVTDGIQLSLTGQNANFPQGLDSQTATQKSRMQIVFSLEWANHRFPIDDVTYDSNYAYVHTTYPYYNAFCISGLHTSTITPGSGKEFYLENSLLLLDKPGEFYFDKAARKMYYYPYANENMATADTWCAITDGMMTITGVSSQNKVTNLEFDGISFRYGGWDDITAKGAAFNQTDEWRLGSETYYGQHIFPGQIWVNFADSLVFKNCEFSSMGSSAMIFEEGVTNSQVTESYFHDLAGTGIMLGDYRDGNSAAVGTERCRNIEVDNNIFRRVAQEFQGLTAISIYYVGNVNVHHNDIQDVPYTGISIGWGWGYDDPTECGNHIISYNKIANAMQTMSDGAHIYTLGNLRGTQINDNYLINPGGIKKPGIYFDQGTGYTSVSDNVVTEAYTTSSEYWFFARQLVNINNCFAGYNHTDGRDPSKIYGTNGTSTNEVTLKGNSYRVSSWSATAQKIMAEAGLEDKTRLNEIDTYPSWRTMRMMDIPAS